MGGPIWAMAVSRQTSPWRMSSKLPRQTVVTNPLLSGVMALGSKRSQYRMVRSLWHESKAVGSLGPRGLRLVGSIRHQIPW